MIVLYYSKKLQKIIGVYRDDLSNPMNYFVNLLTTILFISGMASILVIGSFAFVFVHFSDLPTSTNAIIIMMAGTSGLGCYIGIATKKASIRDLYSILQDVADGSNFILVIIAFSVFILDFNFASRSQVSWLQWLLGG